MQDLMHMQHTTLRHRICYRTELSAGSVAHFNRLQLQHVLRSNLVIYYMHGTSAPPTPEHIKAWCCVPT